MKRLNIYIEPKYIFRVAIVCIVIILIIFFTNMRIHKNKISKPTYEGYVPEIEDMESGDAYNYDFLVIYDYDKVMDYFASTKDALDFKDYLEECIKNTNSPVNEWWVVDEAYNSTKQELTFYLMSNEKEYFIVTTNNENTQIKHTHEAYTQGSNKAAVEK